MNKLNLLLCSLLGATATILHSAVPIQKRLGEYVSSIAIETKLQTMKPLVVFDLETTGLRKKEDAIIEIGAIKTTPKGKAYQFHTLVNPGIDIANKVAQTQGITNYDVKKAPRFSKVAPAFVDFVGDARLGGQSITIFDVPFFIEMCAKNNIPCDLSHVKMVDTSRIFKLQSAYMGHSPQHTKLEYIYNFYYKQHFEGAHTALGDCLASLRVIEAQTKEFGFNLEKMLAHWESLCLTKDGSIIVNKQGKKALTFGKYCGQDITKWISKDPTYLKNYVFTNKCKASQYAKRLIKSMIKHA